MTKKEKQTFFKQFVKEVLKKEEEDGGPEHNSYYAVWDVINDYLVKCNLEINKRGTVKEKNNAPRQQSHQEQAQQDQRPDRPEVPAEGR